MSRERDRIAKRMEKILLQNAIRFRKNFIRSYSPNLDR